MLRGDVEPVRPRQVFQPLAGADVVHGDDRPPSLVVPPQRGGDGDSTPAEEGAFRRRAGVPDLVNAPAAQARLLGDLRVRQPLRVQVLHHPSTEASQFGHLLLCVGQPGRDLAQEQVRIINRHDPLQLVRHDLTS